MKKVMFYCQHILGMGHLIRSVEIVRGLIPDFQICFINGGQVIKEFEFPPEIEVVNIPAIKTDSEFTELTPVDDSLTMSELETIRTKILLDTCDRFQPDILIIELFPFGRRRFSFELIPLMEKAKAMGTKIVSSVRDIVVTKQNQQRHEEKVCRLINKYFDMLLIHGDPNFVKLNLSFSRVADLSCPVHYTGYVVQPLPQPQPIANKPLILVSVGGGRFGHDLLECVAHTASILKDQIPHHLQVFTGAFSPDEVLVKLQQITEDLDNITIERYTPNFLNYMQQADLSIGMGGYNTTMNILSTGVKAMMMAFQGNNDKEQETRLKKLDSLGRVKMIYPEDLQPEKFALQIINYLQQDKTELPLDLDGVNNTREYIKHMVKQHTTLAS
ncbi:glycosyl transferase [Pleurocapsa sp. CCALA 161]|uniref:glycosyltransferase family protein n=1 Tax=Pleurocapsa sp. CCALA 161 TaxID=2107688 RepID=UPI000D06B18A|nr:glycosyltransferase [Pleurocapsa sp. CCALA 161]PSB05904.1 glycosyl transferase [Pleurocapsa sp. CCALA 161]